MSRLRLVSDIDVAVALDRAVRSEKRRSEICMRATAFFAGIVAGALLTLAVMAVTQ